MIIDYIYFRLGSAFNNILHSTIDAANASTARMRITLSTLVIIFISAIPAQASQHTTYFITNAQGTVVAEMDSQGNTTYEAAYRPYGKQQTGDAQMGPGYTGHVNDPDTGLIYMKARYYDATLGRFLSVDPKYASAGNYYDFNRFSYANNNPVINIDPNGQETGKAFHAEWKMMGGRMPPMSPRDKIGKPIAVATGGLMLLPVAIIAVDAAPGAIAATGRRFMAPLLAATLSSNPSVVNHVVELEPESAWAEAVTAMEEGKENIEMAAEAASKEIGIESSVILGWILSNTDQDSASWHSSKSHDSNKDTSPKSREPSDTPPLPNVPQIDRYTPDIKSTNRRNEVEHDYSY
ncbi:hypothetical protein GCM10027285_13710 [Oleiagrimonas citrea]|uniref:Teneurin-like YD-shell domain-containing protein n=1 Tax=Oleiagrimonas citrea TaxID=1665687 RepID=A0A846ZRW8_9GAMM|nr:RHS repeat-associated core domain-containing protein [Oleiagrimonas citrea]NKZ40131.1 hypothetical protein [Oleiagrimonas citrea]